MKKIIFIAFIVFIFTSVLCAASSVNFEWDPNTEPDLAGYRFFQGDASGEYGDSVDISCGPNDGSCSKYTVTGLEDGTYYFTVTAFDGDSNESGFADEISHRVDSIPPDIVTNFRSTGTQKQFKITVETVE